MLNFLNDVDLRVEKKETKLFFQRLKGYLTGNIDNFPKKIEGLRKVDANDLAAAGYHRKKFQTLDNLSWEYTDRHKSVVDDPQKRKLVRDFFESRTSCRFS